LALAAGPPKIERLPLRGNPRREGLPAAAPVFAASLLSSSITFSRFSEKD